MHDFEIMFLALINNARETVFMCFLDMRVIWIKSRFGFFLNNMFTKDIMKKEYFPIFGLTQNRILDIDYDEVMKRDT